MMTSSPREGITKLFAGVVTITTQPLLFTICKDQKSWPFHKFIFSFMAERQLGGVKYLLFRFQITKFLHKGCFWREATWLQEMKQAEELFHSVLQRGPGQQDFVFLEEHEGNNLPVRNRAVFSANTFLSLSLVYFCSLWWVSMYTRCRPQSRDTWTWLLVQGRQTQRTLQQTLEGLPLFLVSLQGGDLRRMAF